MKTDKELNTEHKNTAALSEGCKNTIVGNNGSCGVDDGAVRVPKPSKDFVNTNKDS